MVRRLAAALLVCALALPLAADNVGFVDVDGTRFMLGGQTYRFAGVNYWQGMHLGIDSGDNRARLGRELDHLQSLGIRNVRVLASSEGPDTEPYRVTPSLQSSPGVYNTATLDGLDYVVGELNKRDMRAVMVLNNFWHWSGGMAQYVSWSDGTAIPYPNDTGDWDTYQNYAARFYDSAQCQSWYRDHIRTILERTNPYTGRAYADEPTVFAWELANEPRRYPAEWIDATAEFIKGLDDNHLVTTGSEGSWGAETYLPGHAERGFVPTHDGANIDYATVHIWAENWGWYDPTDPSTLATAKQAARDYLEAHFTDAQALGKPLVLEEFGLARDGGSLDPLSTTTARDEYIEHLLSLVFDSAASGGPAAGDNVWAFSGEGRPGDPLIGDPPHEPAGWYGIYDTDTSTLGILSSHATDMAAVPEPTTLVLLGLSMVTLIRRRR